MHSTESDFATAGTTANSSTKPDCGSDKVIEASRCLRQSATALTLLIFVVWYFSFGTESQRAVENVFLGVVLMSTTFFLYSDLVRMILFREPRLGAVILVAGLKILLLILLLHSKRLLEGSAALWFVLGIGLSIGVTGLGLAILNRDPETK